MKSFSSILAGAALLAASAAAHNIQLYPHSRECFHETLHRDDRMTVTFQVGDREFGGAGNLDVDFWIQDPSGALKVSEHAASSGDYSFEAHLDGKYTYCFSNENSNVGTKEVSFNVHGIVYVPEEPESSDPLEREVRNLGEMLNQVKDEQEYILPHRCRGDERRKKTRGEGLMAYWTGDRYIVVRERVHRNTAESTNARVKWWSIFQLGVVGGNGIFQVWYLKRFFEVKRVV